MSLPSPPRSAHFLAPYRGKRPPAPAWFENSLNNKPERGFFQSGGAGIELLTWGRLGSPGLLFLHGNGAHADWWSHIAPFFATDWRCAALSFSGMGHSGWRAEGYSVDDFAQEARDAVAAAGLDQGRLRPIIIGHSMGGTVGMLAASRDEMFRGLVMVDTLMSIDPELLREIKANAPKARREHIPFRSLEEGLARFRLSPHQDCVNDFIGDYIARCALVERDGQWTWRFDPQRPSFKARDEENIADKLRCPIAYFQGEKSALVTTEALEQSRKILPEGTAIIVIPEAAHHVPVDQPLALISSLRTLLACWPATSA